ncbi:ATP-dependent Clp protease ATP-binding subunit ClpX [candidate division KSB1 bacterium]
MRKNKTTRKGIYCSFCGKSPEETNCIISGPDAYICDQCVSNAKELMKNSYMPRTFSKKKAPTPALIKKELDSYVIGQERAKKILSVAVYNHYKRINSNILIDDDVDIEKSNILLIGPTGTGKTLLARTLAKFLKVPFSISDATTLTEAGYVGEDVENILVRLIQAANYDLEKAEKGIIYIDEFDKIARRESNVSITRDVSGEGVQQALLKILEGTISSIPPKGGRKHPEQNYININTKDILFIVGGTFEGLDETILKRIGKGSIGFKSTQKSNKRSEIGDILELVQPEDLLKFGLIPEIIGRLPVLASLHELDKKALLDILTKPKNAVLKQYEKLFEIEGIKLKFTSDALNEITDITIQRKIGARGLRAVIEDIMLEIMFKIPSVKGVKECIINKKVVRNKTDPNLVFEKIKKGA